MDPKDTFYRQFQTAAGTLSDQITQLPSFSAVGGERQDAIEHILAGISRLSQDVADAADYVPSYDQRGYAKTIKLLSEELDRTTAKFAPKARFQFKPRSKAPPTTTGAVKQQAPDARHYLPSDNYLGRDTNGNTTTTGTETPPAVLASEQRDSVGSLPTIKPKNYNEEISRTVGQGPRKPSFSVARDITLSDHAGLHIILPQSASRATSAGQLVNLENCIIDMSVPTAAAGGGAPFASLALKNISGSLIVAGHVEGPALITGVRDSVVVVAARQVRIHECENVDMYLYCGSHPIIEDCKGMRFAPAPKRHTAENETDGTNQWDQVDDFRWLKAEQSPNWSILPEEERIAEDVWRNIVPGVPGLAPDDILKKVGLRGSSR